MAGLVSIQLHLLVVSPRGKLGTVWFLIRLTNLEKVKIGDFTLRTFQIEYGRKIHCIKIYMIILSFVEEACQGV
jgi:hypothetical protein